MKRLLILLLIFVLGCGTNNVVDERSTVTVVKQGVTEDVSLTTSDNLNIRGSYYEANSDKSLILLHQLNKDRNSWHQFALELKGAGYNVLSIDLRGHGESTGDWNTFGNEDFKNSVLDIKEAEDFLREKHPNTKLGIIGASIGANLAVTYGVKNNIDVLILLSPGTNYREIEIKTKVEDFQKPMLIIVSIGDVYSYESAVELEEVRNRFNLRTDTQFYTSSLHGTAILGNRANKVMVDWLNENL